MPGYHRMLLPKPYRALTELTASGFAWEWVRRDPAFVALWENAGVAVRRVAARAVIVSRRPSPAMTDLQRHPLEGALSRWSLSFAPAPDIPATAQPVIAWLPAIHIAAVTLVRPVPWARSLGDLAYQPAAWGDQVIRIAAHDGAHLLVRRHGAPELALWTPAGLEPHNGRPFGIYLHPGRSYADRVRVAAIFRRAIGLAPALRAEPLPAARRQATMLCIHDLIASGASLRDIAGVLLDPMPGDWRSSSERSDLRRLADTAVEMVGGGYRRLLGTRPTA